MIGEMGSTMVEQLPLEEYSNELVRSSDIYHRLHVATHFLISELQTAEEEANLMREEMLKTSSWDREPFEIASNELVEEQINSLKSIQSLEAENIRRLLQKESAFDLVFENKHPMVIGYPEWIKDLFPYFQPPEVMRKISDDGGTVIRIFEDDFLAIQTSVHESFIQVWWPIAGQVAEPGYLERRGERTWESIGLER